MIGIADVQQALVTKVNALISSGMVTPATLGVAEFNFQSQTYAYPCIRVRVGPLTPKQRSGNCQAVVAGFEIIAYSEDPSSSQVSSIAKSLENNLNNRRLTVATNTSNPIRVIRVVGPIPLAGERGWAEHLLAEIEVPS